MARIKKKGKAGQAKNFITRTQAVRKLQVSLPDFRRLCIFKGIYPREPRNKKKASRTSGPNTTFYYSKDIQYLLHEPLLNKFREHKAVSKKIARSLGKGEVGDAARLDKIHNKKLSLDHIIKERYPTFVDALRDLDDALSLLFLFSSLPSTSTVPAKTIALCQRLCHEFQHYLIVAHALRKSFISIKGIYYQATIQGQDILWLVPHKFVQRVTGDVDFRIMGTFVEFYTTLLGFVNYRLYTTVGLVYPPKFDIKADEDGGDLDAFRIENRGLQNGSKKTTEETLGDGMTGNAPKIDEAAQKRVDSLAAGVTSATDDRSDASTEQRATETQQGADSIDNFEITAKGGDVLVQPSIEASSAGSLFDGLIFYINRESPRQPLEFLLRAFGSKRIGWDSVLGSGAFSNNELDPSITHQIIDRPPVMAEQNTETQDGDNDEDEPVERPKTFQYGFRVPGRLYVQPQWVWDCINAGKLLRPDAYAPGELLPPHLSPFVKPKQGAYDPTKTLAEQEREGEVEEFEEAEREARALEDGTNGQGKGSMSAVDGVEGADEFDEEEEDDNGMSVVTGDDDDDDDDENEADENGGEFAGLSDADLDEAEDDDELDEATKAAKEHQAELVAEARGLELSDGKKAGKKTSEEEERARLIRAVERKRKAEAEERTRRMGMMPRKKKKLYEKMQYGLERDKDEAEKLRTKRRRLEKESGR